MIDGYGRTIDYIRISVIDRCGLRCVYCMPEEGIDPVAHEDILTYDEIIRLTKIFAGLGIRKVKLTGGEPLVRRNIEVLVAALRTIPEIREVTLTTNGMALEEKMEALAAAGISGINLSLDTLDPDVFEKITRRRALDEVMRGFYAALAYHPQIPLKINCVPMGLPGQDVTEVARLAKEYPVHVRFIEIMPIGLGRNFEFQSEDSLLRQLAGRYGAYQPYEKRLGNGPGHYYSFPDFQGKIGFISALSHKFCDSCNRVRLTSQGYLKTCLQYDIGTDLRALLRGNADDEALRKAIEEAIQRKPKSHQFTETVGEHREMHTMSQIGG